MKLLYYAPYAAPGDALVFDAAEAGGHRLRCVSTVPRMPEHYPTAHDVAYAPAEIAAHAPGWIGRVAAYRHRTKAARATAALLAEQIAEFRPDLVIASDAELGLPVALKASGVPVVALSHGSDVTVVPARGVRQRRAVVNALRAARGVMAFTAAHAAVITAVMASGEITAAEAFAANPPFILGGWVDCGRFSPRPFPDRAKPPLVLCLRGSTPVYRPEIVVRACALAASRLPLTLRMAVQREHLAALKREIEACGWSTAHVEFVTERLPHEGMPDEYAAATLVFQAIEWESLGLTTLEAMACGRPVAQPRAGVALELLPEEQHELLGGSDAESLAESITRALRNQALLERIGARNRAVALERFDRERQPALVAPRLTAWLEKAGA